MSTYTFQVNELQAALRLAQRVVPRNSPLPALAYGALSVDAAGVTRLRVTDLAQTLTLPLPCQRDQAPEPGQWLLPISRLAAVVSSLTTETVTLRVDHPPYRLQAGSVRVRLETLPSAQYPDSDPPVATDERFGPCEVSATGLAAALAQVGYACLARQADWTVMRGVHLMVCGAELICEATDGKRLAQTRLPLLGDTAAEASWEGVVGGTSLPLVSALLAQADGPVRLSGDTRALSVEVGERLLQLTLLEGKYPDTAGIIGQRPAPDATIDRAAWLAATELCLAAVPEGELWHLPRSGGLDLAARGPNGSVRVTLPAEWTDGVLLPRWAVPGGQLREILRVRQEERLALSMATPVSALHLYPVQGEHPLTLLMPLAGNPAGIPTEED